jgi:hypothetical protein
MRNSPTNRPDTEMDTSSSERLPPDNLNRVNISQMPLTADISTHNPSQGQSVASPLHSGM